ncbi:sugar transporter [Marimonas lutisalis]|uniref:sugar transporter n=1 Tax=Marimonas lutisalis TaxID=2545756 RepID=UPI0010F7AAB6|nr:sugar transporter [Marimonas lutisalis]
MDTEKTAQPAVKPDEKVQDNTPETAEEQAQARKKRNKNKGAGQVNPRQQRREEQARRKAEEAERAQKVIDAIKVSPPARPSRPRRRHWGVLVSFFVFVCLPLAVEWWYLHARAADQYASDVGFSVRTEETSSAMELLGGLSQISRASSSDTDILYEFIQSQELVSRIDERLNLREIYSKPENDPVFSFPENGTIEDLVDYWSRMVKIDYDATAGLLVLRVLAFDPVDSHTIASVIFEESSAKINELSAIAREDATRYAREELEVAIERLKQARRAITDFRNKHQLVDPQTDIQGQIGLLNTLQQQLAEALIELDILSTTTSETDPRVVQVQRKIDVIRARIRAERQKFGQAGALSGEAYSTLLGDYEELDVDREFAEQAYLSALSAFDEAKAEAQRQSRYLAPFISPTRAEKSTYPRRDMILLISALFIVLSWSTGVLLSYAIKDRR